MQNRPHIVLIGPMGSGKSTLGRALAALLGRDFVDLDARIEQAAGCAITAIFEREGEAGFREHEARALHAALTDAPAVIASGGGAVLRPDNRAAMRQAATVVYLQTDAATQLARLAGDRSRPLLQTADPAQTLARLQAQREPLYRTCAHLLFDTSAQTPEAAAAALAQQLHELQESPA